MSLWYHFVRNTSQAYFRLFYDLRHNGLENIPDGGCIIASNHVSFYDPPLIGSVIPKDTYYLARKTLFVPPVMDKLLPTIHAVPVDQERPDMAGLKRIITTLKGGHPVILFPEGARSYDGKLQAGMPGVGMLVAKTGVPVVPTRVFGVHKAWPRSGKITWCLPTEVTFGKSLRFENTKDYQSVSDRIMQAISELRPIQHSLTT